MLHARKITSNLFDIRHKYTNPRFNEDKKKIGPISDCGHGYQQQQRRLRRTYSPALQASLARSLYQ